MVRCRSGDRFDVFTSATTNYRVLRNLDGLDRDRTPKTREGAPLDANADQALARYVMRDKWVAVHGVYQIHEGKSRFDAKVVHLLHFKGDGFLFEETHWWLTQIARMADEWLEDVFGDRRSYPFITGRSTPDSYLTGQKLVETLDGQPPLRRFGW